jgi:hypothetical protein
MPGKAELAQALVEHERCGVAEVQAAAVRAHGNTQAAPASQVVDHCLRQAPGFRAEQQQVAVA